MVRPHQENTLDLQCNGYRQAKNKKKIILMILRLKESFILPSLYINEIQCVPLEMLVPAETPILCLLKAKIVYHLAFSVKYRRLADTTQKPVTFNSIRSVLQQCVNLTKYGTFFIVSSNIHKFFVIKRLHVIQRIQIKLPTEAAFTHKHIDTLTSRESPQK